MYVRMYVCMYVCMYVRTCKYLLRYSVYVHIYIYQHIHLYVLCPVRKPTCILCTHVYANMQDKHMFVWMYVGHTESACYGWQHGVRSKVRPQRTQKVTRASSRVAPSHWPCGVDC